MARRGIVAGGTVLAGVTGYYLYSAGGSPKVAEKQFEHDAARASANIKGHLPGTTKEAKTQAKLTGEEAGQKFDSAVAQARDTTHKVDAKLEDYRQSAEKKIGDYRKETGQKLTSAVDKFDQSVEKTAAKSKSWLSGWF